MIDLSEYCTLKRTEVQDIADKIREKTGGTEGIKPSEMPAEIETLVNPVDYLAAVCNKEITELVNDKITTIFKEFQKDNTNLVKVDLPSITTLKSNSFLGCSNLKCPVIFPSVTAIETACFQGSRITEIYLPELIENDSSTQGYNFAFCYNLEKAVFNKFVGSFRNCDFRDACRLKTVILGANEICTLANANAFQDTPIAGNTNYTDGELGYIYVKSALVEEYKAATNWSTYADQFRAIEDYPEICGGVV